MSSRGDQPRSPFSYWWGIFGTGYLLIAASSTIGDVIGIEFAPYVGGAMAIVILGGGSLMLGWLFLFAPEAGLPKSTAQSQQFSIGDVLVLTSVLALEVAAAAQNNALLFCLFITVFISTLALVWKRTMLRRVLVISTVLILILTIVFTLRGQ